jgi:predicted naringenin-chalcone synthase
MRLSEARVPELAAKTVEKLGRNQNRDLVTYLLITCCTGSSAPGLDIEVIERCKLPGSIERTIIGFMGCYAAINALKLARHIVRSEPHEIAPELTGHGLPLSKCEAYDRVYDQSFGSN